MHEFDSCHAAYRVLRMNDAAKLSGSLREYIAVRARTDERVNGNLYVADFERAAAYSLAEHRFLLRLFHIYVVQDPLNFLWAEPGESGEELNAQHRQAHFVQSAACMGVSWPHFEDEWQRLKRMCAPELVARGLYPVWQYFRPTLRISPSEKHLTTSFASATIPAGV